MARLGSRPPWPTLGSVVEIPSHSGSDESFNFIQPRIENCTSSGKHKLCNASVSGILPTRLLDVGGEHVRLCQAKQKSANYIALSHCWGSGPLLTTTETNLKMHQDEIQWDALPALFQDSIEITRRLGLRYLWIDSLCILQDSKEDWELESTKMSDIFEHAYLVLSAVDSAHSGEKCLLPRRKTLKFRYVNTTGKEFKVHARHVVDHHFHPNDLSPAQPFGPLMSRAWALQEQALPRRVVHYTSTELIFECRTAVSCECRPPPRSHPTTPGLLARSLLQKKDHTTLYTAWHHIINKYSLRSISRLSDRLPAISGVANKIQHSSRSPYLAGLWQENVASDLLWSSAPHLQDPHRANRVEGYRAPSFSWASVETQVQYDVADEEIESTPLIDVLKAESTAAGLNPLGEVTDGWISLRAPVLEGVFVAPAERTFHYRLKLAGQVLDVCPDSLLVEAEWDSEAEGKQMTVRRAREDENYNAFKVPVTCMGVSTSSDQCLAGLVLAPSFRITGAYERVGMFTCAHAVFEGAKKKSIKFV